MPDEPSGVGVWSPKIRDEALARKFLSLGGEGYVAISIQDGLAGTVTPTDPDAESLGLVIWFNDVLASVPSTNPYGSQVLAVTADSITRDDAGKYYFDIGPELTSNRGLITAVWTYTINSVPFQFTDHLQILDPMPFYDTLSAAERSIVEQVTWYFADFYDSTDGGPHFQEEFQTHWNYERIAQMMRLAVTRMNFIGNYGNTPTSWTVGGMTSASYTVPGTTVTNTQVLPSGQVNSSTYTNPTSTDSTSVPSNFSGLLVLGTYIECLRHFRDTYTEIPDRPGMDVTYTNRRDYWNRWTANLQAEQQEYESMVKKAKLSLLNLSRGSLLVAGGIYGGSALGIFQAGTYAAQVRSWRFYPAAPAISWGATAH